MKPLSSILVGLLCLFLLLSSLSCKKGLTSNEPLVPTSSPPNLISNGDFEHLGQPSLQGWVVADTLGAKLVNDAPPGGGTWALHLSAPWIYKPGPVTYVTGQSGTGVYKLTAYIKNIVDKGAIFVALWQHGQASTFKTAAEDTTGWRPVTIIDTLSLQPTDSIAVGFGVGCCMARIPANQARLGHVRLERLE
jgi:hypothetical protein